MKQQKLNDKRAKLYFESCYKVSISIKTWYRLKSLMMEFDLTITKENLEIVAKLKRQSLYLKISLKQILSYYLKALEIVTQQGTITGNNLYLELQRLTEYKAHRTTITRWFKLLPPINGIHFDRSRKYTHIELSLVYLAAFLYKSKPRKRRRYSCN